MASKLVLTKADHQKIQEIAEVKDDEEYSVVTTRIHGEWKRTIHVFSRLPTTKELTDFENSSSKVKFRGAGKAEVDSQQAKASEALYNKLIDRVFDQPIGTRVFGEVIINADGTRTGKPLGAEEARSRVPVMAKREALRDFLGEVYSESRIAEREGEDDEVKAKDDED